MEMRFEKNCGTNKIILLTSNDGYNEQALANFINKHHDMIDLIVISEKGQVIRLPFKAVNKLGRDTQGVKIMRFKEDSDRVACVTWV